MLDIRDMQQQIDQGMAPLLRSLRARYGFDRLSVFAFRQFEQFGLRKGNRVRSVLMLVSYLGYSGKRLTPALCSWASSLELIQNFILIHDDIIDNATLRRGSPALHISMNRLLAGRDGEKTGRDIALTIGDIFFSAGIDLFASIREAPQRKEKALAELMQAAVATGCGEINELMLDRAAIDGVTRADIIKAYDLKTARYTFITPLLLGAVLGGAPACDMKTLERIGLLCGRAFQIRDDIAELLSSEQEVKKTFLADLKASKKTILLWYFLQRANIRDRRLCSDIFAKHRKTPTELKRIKTLFLSHDVVLDGEKEIQSMVRRALCAVGALSAAPAAKTALAEIISKIAAAHKTE